MQNFWSELTPTASLVSAVCSIHFSRGGEACACSAASRTVGSPNPASDHTTKAASIAGKRVRIARVRGLMGFLSFSISLTPEVYARRHCPVNIEKP
jgi:hypothetical protein